MMSGNIHCIGVNDRRIDLFESQYAVPNGVTYNSYVITDSKIAVMDTVDAAFTHEWLDNLEAVLGGRKPDYLVVQHMEPDHSASIAVFRKNYPDTAIVATSKAFSMMRQFFGKDFSENRNNRVRRRHPSAGNTHPTFCCGSHGALAGGHRQL